MYLERKDEVTSLTPDAVRMINENQVAPNAVLIMQVLELNHPKQSFSLSDGYGKFPDCQLGSQSLPPNALSNNSVIELRFEDLQKDNDAYILRRCEIVNNKVENQIGEPMPISMFKLANYKNERGDNNLKKTPFKVSINLITRTKNVIKFAGRVSNLPKRLSSSTKTFMMFDVQDLYGNSVTMFCFEEDAAKMHKFLKEKETYTFDGYHIVESKKRLGEFEFKLTKQSVVQQIEIEGHVPWKSDEQKCHGAKNEHFADDREWTIAEIKSKINESPRDQMVEFGCVFGKVTYLATGDKEYLKLNIEQQNGRIDVVVSEEKDFEIEKGKSYRLTCMRGKLNTKGYHQLYSCRSTTVEEVEPTHPSLSLRGPGNQHKVQTGSVQCKKPPSNLPFDKIVDLAFIKGIRIEEINDKRFEYAYCTIFLKLVSIHSKSDEDARNFFKGFCKEDNCRRAFTPTQKKRCFSCNSRNVDFRWNLSVEIKDQSGKFDYRDVEVKDETTTRFLEIPASEAIELFYNDKTKFQAIFEGKDIPLRLCKFNLKAKDNRIYYEILEIYSRDEQFDTAYYDQMLKNTLESIRVETKQREDYLTSHGIDPHEWLQQCQDLL